jgi:hypothetical protein
MQSPEFKPQSYQIKKKKRERERELDVGVLLEFWRKEEGDALMPQRWQNWWYNSLELLMTILPL